MSEPSRVVAILLGAAVLSTCSAPNPAVAEAVEVAAEDGPLRCALRIRSVEIEDPDGFGIDPALFRDRLHAALRELEVAVIVGEVGDSTTPTVDLEIVIDRQSSLADQGQLTRRAWLSTPLWFAAWIPSLFVEDRAFPSTLRTSCTLARGKPEEKTLEVVTRDPIHVDYLDRSDLLAWRTLLTFFVPPYLVGNDEERVHDVMLDRACRNLAAGIGGELRHWAASSWSEGLTEFSGDRRALLVGIDEYRFQSRLENAERDVGEIARVLEEAGWTEVVTLTGSQADRSGILNAVDDMRRRSEVGDLVLFYFAGHGLGERDALYLMPPTASRPSSEGLQFSKVVEQLSFPDEGGAPAPERQLYVLDCCHGGGAKVAFRSVPSPARWSELSLGGAKVALTSTTGRELAFDGAPGQLSPFARALSAVLRDRSFDRDQNGLSARELFEGVSSLLRADAGESRGSMTPQLLGSRVDEVLLVPGSSARR